MNFEGLDREMWLCQRLKQHGAHIFDGTTDRDTRKQRVREAISQVGALVVVGRGKDQRPVTYAECFATVYGEPLIPPAKSLADSTADHAARSAADLPGSDAAGVP